MIAADVPPAAEVVVVSRRDDSEVVAAQDLPLVLVKGTRREDALVRRAVFVSASLTVTRAAAEGAAPDRYRWTYRSFLQRQVCFTSMTGLFACTEPQVEKLPEVAEGDAALMPDPASFPLADAARATLVSGLKARATAVFAADRRAAIDPIFKASGVTVQAR
jgi:hypothetical protein